MTQQIVYSIKGKGLKLNSAEDVKQFCDEIKAISGLTEIELSGNTFGVEAAKAIAESIKDQHDLTVFNID
jgi:Ran GTPase-activating protein 1